MSSYGIRQGENYGKEAGAAVVFIDSPILDICDIVDLPGYGTETESDDDITFAATQEVEIVIYLSQANGFMRIEDINYLKQNIAQLPVWEKKGVNDLRPLANLFVVASQAHTINAGNRKELERIFDKGCENLTKTLDRDYWKKRAALSGYDYSIPDVNGNSALRNRFFAYTTDIPDICIAFNEQLKEVLEALPPIIDEQAKSAVRSYIDGRKPSLAKELQKYEDIISQRDQYVALLEEINSHELGRVQENDKRKVEVLTAIGDAQAESKHEFKEFLAQVLDLDSLVQNMEQTGLKNKKDDIEQFTSRLQSQIQHKCENILEEQSKLVSKKTADYLTSFSDSISLPAQDLNIEVDFDAGWAFASALSTLGTVGGIGALAVGAVSEAIFWGSALGIGSVAFGAIEGAFMALFFAPFAPIGLALGLGLAAGMGALKLFGGGWEKSVAKKIVSQIEKGQFGEKFCAGMDTYWQSTKDAFNKAADELDINWRNYVKELEGLVDSDDIAEVSTKIAALKNIEFFFDNIPL